MRSKGVVLTWTDPTVKDFSVGVDVGSVRGLFKITEEHWRNEDTAQGKILKQKMFHTGTHQQKEYTRCQWSPLEQVCRLCFLALEIGHFPTALLLFLTCFFPTVLFGHVFTEGPAEMRAAKAYRASIHPGWCWLVARPWSWGDEGPCCYSAHFSHTAPVIKPKKKIQTPVYFYSTGNGYSEL